MNVNDFGENVNKQELFDLLFTEERFELIIKTAEAFGHKRDEALANRIIDAGGAKEVARGLQHFPRMSRSVYLRLVQASPKEAVSTILLFDGITKDDVYTAVTSEGTLNDAGYIVELLNNPAQVEGIQLNQEFAEKLAQGSEYYFLLSNLEKFNLTDITALVDILIQVGRMHDVLSYVAMLKGIDHEWLAEKAIETGYGESLIDFYPHFQGLDDCKMVRKLMQKGGSLVYAVVRHVDAFKGIGTDRKLGEQLFKACLPLAWDARLMARLHDLYAPPIDKAFVIAYDLLGDLLTPRSYATIRDLQNGTIHATELKALDIEKTGETGVNQLRQRLARFKSEILSADFDASLLLGTDFYGQYYKSYVRYTESDFGDHDESSFEQIVEAYERLKQEGTLRALPAAFVPSGEVQIEKVDRQKQEAFTYSEQFLSRYTTFQSSMRDALRLFDQKKPLSSLAERAETKRVGLKDSIQEEMMRLRSKERIDDWIKQLGEDLQNETDVIAKKAIEKKMATLQNERSREFMAKNLEASFEKLDHLDLRNVKNFEANFEALSHFGEFHEELRQLTFYYALGKNKTLREPAMRLTQKDQPQFDDVGWMINFIDHIVNEETWSQYFTDAKATKAFRKLININALHEEFARAQNQEAQGTSAMEFVPTRGLLMEFSGHIADACWASKYTSIAELFPNFSSVVLLQNRGTKHERLAGASMLIETQAQDGTPLLVVRGLNPIENVINALSVEDFYNQFTAYISQIAKKAGRRAAIVIDDHSGGSASNRPALFQFLTKKKKDLTQVRLASESDTSFNEYDIVGCTYFIE